MERGLHSSDPPPAVGYIRVIRLESQPVDAIAERLCEYGARAGFSVDTVLREDVPRDRADADSGFLTLLGEVRRRDARAVVIPSPAHLSLFPDVRRWMTRMLRDAGAQLVVVPNAAIGAARIEPLPPPR